MSPVVPVIVCGRKARSGRYGATEPLTLPSGEEVGCGRAIHETGAGWALEVRVHQLPGFDAPASEVEVPDVAVGMLGWEGGPPGRKKTMRDRLGEEVEVESLDVATSDGETVGLLPADEPHPARGITLCLDCAKKLGWRTLTVPAAETEPADRHPKGSARHDRRPGPKEIERKLGPIRPPEEEE